MNRFLLAALLIVGLAAAAHAQPTVTYNIANAPAWQASTTYSTIGARGIGSNRVLAGPALVPGGSPTYTAGSPLYLLELTGAGTSGATKPTVSSCPSTGIADGTATWKCLTVVDYITATSAFEDDNTVWAPHTGAACSGITQAGCYYDGQYVVNGTGIYRMQGGTLGAGSQCTAASSGSGPPAADGTCGWALRAVIPYRSGRNPGFPHIRYGAAHHGTIGAVIAQQNSVFVIWHGGVARDTYTAGANNERPTIGTYNHWDLGPNEQSPDCADESTNWWNSGQGAGCPGGPTGFITVKAAPGDGVCDALGSPLRWDPANGVAFLNTANGQSAFRNGDTKARYDCLQFKNTGNSLLSGVWEIGLDNSGINSAWYGDGIYGDGGGYRTALNTIDKSVIDSTGIMSIYGDAGNTLTNSLIINRSTLDGAIGVFIQYENSIVANNTFISLGTGANRTAMVWDTWWNAITTPWGGNCANPLIQNNAFFGWDNVIASKSGIFCLGGAPPFGNPIYTGFITYYNITDLPNTTPGTTFNSTVECTSSGPSCNPITPYKLDVNNNGNNLFNKSASAMFVNPTNDFRLKSGSPGIGIGAALPTVNAIFDPGQLPVTNVTDIYGITRSPSYDVGPVEFGGSPPPVGGRPLR